MNLTKKKISFGGIFVVAVLMLMIFNATATAVYADNNWYSFVFSWEGDWYTTSTVRKSRDYDQAYIQCTSADSENGYFDVWFYAWNSDDGTQCVSDRYTLWLYSQRWVDNSACAGDDTWFYGELAHSGFDPDDGGIFYGWWRPDSSIY